MYFWTSINNLRMADTSEVKNVLPIIKYTLHACTVLHNRLLTYTSNFFLLNLDGSFDKKLRTHESTRIGKCPNKKMSKFLIIGKLPNLNFRDILFF